MSQEEKQGFLQKFKKPFRSHSRTSSTSSNTLDKKSNEASVIDESYKAGNQNFVRDQGITVEKRGKNSASNEKKQSSHDDDDGYVVATSSMGRVVSRPRKISREPVEKDVGGDFANEKSPIDNSLVEAQADDKQFVTENVRPSYGDDANPKEGTGVFFDPKDTQGGMYGNSENVELSEATQAELDKRGNLKTRPAAYYEQEKQQELEKAYQDIKNSAYREGQKRAQEDAERSSKGRGSSEKSSLISEPKTSTLDPKKEHEKNRSAFNTQGFSTAATEAAGRAHNQKDFNSNPSETGGACAAKSGVDPEYDARGTKKLSSNDTSKQGYSARPTEGLGADDDDDEDYKRQIKELDKRIASTQNQINQLNIDNAAVPTSSTRAVKSEKVGPNKGSNKGSDFSTSGLLAGSTVGAAVAGAAGYVGFSGKDKSAASNKEVVDQAYSEGTKKASYEAGSKYKGNVNLMGSLSSGKDNYSGFRQDFNNDKHPSAVSSYSKGTEHPSSNEDGSVNAGIIGGAAGALSAAGAVAASKVGFGSNDPAEEVKKDAYDEGQSRGKQGLSKDSKSSSIETPQHGNVESTSKAEKSGFLSSITGAFGGIGGQSSTSENTGKSVKEEAYEHGQQKGEYDLDLNKGEAIGKHASSEPGSKKASESDDANTSYTSGIIGSVSGAIGGAAAAVGLSSATHGTNTDSKGTGQGESLIASAERQHEDVAKAPAHKTRTDFEETSGNDANQGGAGVQEVPGLAPQSEDSSKGSTSNTKSTRDFEADIAKHNRERGVKNDKRSLMEVAEVNSPELRNLDRHKKVATTDVPESTSNQTNDVQAVPIESFENQSTFVRTGGKEGSLNDRTVNLNIGYDNATLTGNYGKEGKKKTPILSNEDNKLKGGSATADLKLRELSTGLDPTHQNVIDSAYSQGETATAHNSGSRSGVSDVDSKSKSKSTFHRGKKDEHVINSAYSQGIATSSYDQGLQSGSYEAGNVAAATELSGADAKELSKSLHDHNKSGKYGTYGAAGTIGAFGASSSSRDRKNANQTREQNLPSKEEHEHYVAGVLNAAYKEGIKKGSYEAGQVAATKRISQFSDSRGINSRAITGSSDKRKGESSLLVEVVGVEDEKEASRIAHQTSQELRSQGVDLSHGKLIIDTKKGEVYKTDDTHSSSKSHGNSYSVAGTGGTTDDVSGRIHAKAQGKGASNSHTGGDTRGLNTGAVLGGAGTGAGSGAAAAYSAHQTGNNGDNQDFKNYQEHQKAKDRLSAAAQTSSLSYDSPKEPNSSTVGGGVDSPGFGSEDVEKSKKSTNHHKSSGPSGTKQTENIVVTVQGTKDNALATRLASEAVEALKQDPEALNSVKKLNIDAKSGNVTDENGRQIYLNPSSNVEQHKPSAPEAYNSGVGEKKHGAGADLYPSSKGVDSKTNKSGHRSAGTAAAVGAAGAAGVAAASYASHRGQHEDLSHADANAAVPTSSKSLPVEVIGASPANKSAIQEQITQHLQSFPSAVPKDTTGKITYDAKTGMATDSNGHKLSALSDLVNTNNKFDQSTRATNNTTTSTTAGTSFTTNEDVNTSADHSNISMPGSFF